jgi:hypothetical protein
VPVYLEERVRRSWEKGGFSKSTGIPGAFRELYYIGSPGGGGTTEVVTTN